MRVEEGGVGAYVPHGDVGANGAGERPGGGGGRRRWEVEGVARES